MSETCCAWLAENTGRKKVAKNRNLVTIPQLCRAISSQLRHVLTIGKIMLSSNMSSTCPINMVNLGPLAAEIDPVVWGTSANFNGFLLLFLLFYRCDWNGTPGGSACWQVPPAIGRQSCLLQRLDKYHKRTILMKTSTV